MALDHIKFFPPLTLVLILSWQEISKKLFRILDKVHRAYEHYKKEDFDPKLEKEYLLTPTWQEKNRRSRFMDEVDDALDDSVLKVHELEMVLQSLRTWRKTYGMMTVGGRAEKLPLFQKSQQRDSFL